MRKIINILIFLVIAVPVGVIAQQIPAFPMSFWGNVTINNNPAPVDTVIRAYYGDVSTDQAIGQVVVKKTGIYGYTEPTKQKLVVGESNGEITFTFQSAELNDGVETKGNDPQTHPAFNSGETVENNLKFTFTVAESTPPQSGSGDSESSSGGSSYGPPTSSTKPADSNKDGKVNILDFNALIVHWGETTVNNVADFNNDGKVDIFDFNLLVINWTK